MGYVHAFMTADVTNTYGETEHGWIDPDWSRFILHESRNDVGTVFSVDDRDVDLMDYISEATAGMFNNGNGTFYSQCPEQNIQTGYWWSYAIHLVHKFFGPDGWTETPYVPVFLTELTESTQHVKVFQEL